MEYVRTSYSVHRKVVSPLDGLDDAFEVNNNIERKRQIARAKKTQS